MKPKLLILVAFLISLAPTLAPAQHPLEFEVASVRQNKSGPGPSGDSTTSNVPLGPGDAFNPIDGLFRATNFPLITYIAFAYRMTDAQLEAFRNAAPGWVLTDRFNIEARVPDPQATKDQIRLMMRALLAERFHLAMHEEARVMSVFALILAKPGTTGPRLQPHPAGSPCPRDFGAPKPTGGSPRPEPKETIDGGYPYVCGAILGIAASSADRYSFGARDVPMRVLCNSFPSWGNLGRPVIDQTGLTGSYDFVLDFTPDPPTPNAPDSGGPTFQAALEHQLGLKLKAQRGQVQLLALDHIDHLTEN